MWWGFNIVLAPSPDLTRIVYPTAGDVRAVVLWDLLQQKEILRVYGRNWGSYPRWTRDGSYFVYSAPPKLGSDAHPLYNVDDSLPYVAGDDLLLVSRDGVIQRLTYLTTQYVALESGYAFSPDEKSITFWLATDYKTSETEWRFAVLDIPSGKVTNYCLSGGNTDNPYPPVWSPDGRYVMLTQEDRTATTTTTKVMIVDLVNNTVADLAQDAVGMGWPLREK